jgi:hypothetical protein
MGQFIVDLPMNNRQFLVIEIIDIYPNLKKKRGIAFPQTREKLL